MTEQKVDINRDYLIQLMRQECVTINNNYNKYSHYACPPDPHKLPLPSFKLLHNNKIK